MGFDGPKGCYAAGPVTGIVYDGTTENPTEQSLLDCLALWAEHGCDGVIALGGADRAEEKIVPEKHASKTVRACLLRAIRVSSPKRRRESERSTNST